MKNKEHHGAKIEVTKGGPYLVSGGVSANKPLCDGPHAS